MPKIWLPLGGLPAVALAGRYIWKGRNVREALTAAMLAAFDAEPYGDRMTCRSDSESHLHGRRVNRLCARCFYAHKHKVIGYD